MLYHKPSMGADVESFKFDEVFGGGDCNGTLQRYMLVGDERVGKAPKNLSFEEAAASVTAGETSLNALLYGPSRLSSLRHVRDAAVWMEGADFWVQVPLKKGLTVLTQETGGVNCFVIQVSQDSQIRTTSQC